VHHLSAAPIVIGVGVLLAYLGLASGLGDLVSGTITSGAYLLGVGALVFLAGIFVWLREDVGMWRDGYVDHGVSPGRDMGWWGMMFFLGTEVMLFGGLFAGFFVTRGDALDVWTKAHEVLKGAIPLVTINTLILMSSGATMHMALLSLQKEKRQRFIALLVLTILLGATFLTIQVNEYRKLISEDIIINAGDLGQFGSVFYLLTGTHAFHVFLGLVFLTIVLVRALMGQFTSHRHVAVDAFAIYWHFVDVVWIILYFVVYQGVV
jgi:heme/copper-type cytochrome/quinol oxidase subunit 3